MDITHCSHPLPHGITLHSRVSGPVDGPLLLLLHGFPEAAFVWDDLLRHFSLPQHGGYRCVAPNLRGYPPSSAPDDVAAYRTRHLVSDLLALIRTEAGPSGRAAAVVAHDWGGALAWVLAAQHPSCMDRLTIINAPHPATFVRELQQSTEQQAASAYMNFLARPDAPELLAENDFRRLWDFFDRMGASDGPHAWLTPELRQRYRESWSLGLRGPCHYYGASPMRPATAEHSHAQGLALPDELCRVEVATQVIWGLQDTALPATLLDGLDAWVPSLRLDRVADATHWIVHEQPQRVIALIGEFLAGNPPTHRV